MAIRSGYSNNRQSRLVSASNPYHREAQSSTRVGCRLYIGNLSWDVKWQDLKDYFATVGRVVRADVEEENGKSKGWGIVEYSSPEEASEAMMRLNDTDLKGRPVHVREDREPGGKLNKPHTAPLQSNYRQTHQSIGPMGCKVYVGNLSWEVKWQDLKDYFKSVGFVVKADVMEEQDGRSKGCGIVEFNSPIDAQRAVQMLNDTELKGRLIFVREDREEGGGGGEFYNPQRHVQMPPMHMQQQHHQMSHQPHSQAHIVHHAPHHSQHIQSHSQPHHQSASTGNVGCRIYVGNLSWDVKWQELKDFFRPCGNVVRADVMEEPSGRSKGCGLVEFSSPQEAQRAISELNDTDLMGRPVFIREDREEGGGGGGRAPVERERQMPNRQIQYSHPVPGQTQVAHSGGEGRKIYVGNLSWEVKWQELKDFFKQCGTVVRADVIEEPGGRSKGCGIVEFATPQEAQRAISELNDTDLMGRPVFIREDREEGGR